MSGREAGLRAVLKAKEARVLSDAAALRQLRAKAKRLEAQAKALRRSLSAAGEARDIATMQAEADWHTATLARLARLDKALDEAQRAVADAERALARTMGESRGIESLLARAGAERRAAREAAEENDRPAPPARR